MLTRLAIPSLLLLAASLAGCGQSPPAAPQYPLAGTEWGLAGNPPPERFVQFVPEGQFGGFAGCNQIFGGYTQDGEKLTFDRVATTRMACPGADIMAAEAAFIAMLNETRAATVSSGVMTLKREDGSTIVELVRRDPD